MTKEIENELQTTESACNNWINENINATLEEAFYAGALFESLKKKQNDTEKI